MQKTAIVALVILLLAGCSALGGNALSGALPPASESSQNRDVGRDNAGAIVATARKITGGIRDLGRTTATKRMHLAVMLAYRNQSDLDRLVAEQRLLGSRDYHKWLNTEEFNARFAPSKGDYLRVASKLQQAGFTIDRRYDNRTDIDVTGPILDVERYFDTEIHDIALAGRHGQVNVTAAHAPRGLAGAIFAVTGLSTLPFVEPLYRRAKPDPIRAANQARSPGWPILGPPSTYNGLEGYGPRAFDVAYDLPVAHSYDGKGRSSAVVNDADFTDSDLTSFMAYFKIARTGPNTVRVAVDGGSLPGNQSADTIETTLDVETIVANAPGTALYVYEIPDLTSKSITDAYNRIVSDNKVDAVNSSFGGCEVFEVSSARAWSALAQQGAAKGITFSASSGDGGGLLCASAPASSPYFVAVGGTSLNVGKNGAWLSEIGWGGSGGGVSSVFSQPAWQQGFTGANNRGRSIPDVSLDANPQTGAAFFLNSWGWNSPYNPIGGTSLSSPIFVAAATELDQVKNGRLGLDAASLYSVWKANGYGSAATPYFHDVVQGGNGAYYTEPGYDLVTGIGAPDFWNIGGKL